MKSEDVTEFNLVIGNKPKEDINELWEQIELQAKLLLEEAKETYEAAKRRDMTEVLDGHLDTRYVNHYLQDLLEAANVDVRRGWEMVVDNNKAKYTKSPIKAYNAKEQHNKVVTNESERVEVESISFPNGVENPTVFYVLKRADGKVVKFPDHEQVQLHLCVPSKFLES